MHNPLHLISKFSSIHNCFTMHLLLAIALPAILLYLLHRRIIKKPKTLIPAGPSGLPLIGNLHQLGDASTRHIYLWKMSKKYGPIFRMKLGPIPLVVVSSAKLAKEVLKTHDLALCSRPKNLGQHKLSYNSSDIAFAPYTDNWREVRKIATTHLLSLRKIKSFRLIREDEVSRMISKISEAPGLVNLNEMAMSMACTLICRIAFGKRNSVEGDDQSELRRFEKLEREAQAVISSLYVSDYYPWLGWIDKLTGQMDRLEEAFWDLDSFYQELIDEHLDPTRAKKMAEEEEDIIDILIKLKEQKSSSMELDWDHIKAILMNVFVAATGTSTITTVWTMMSLIKAPDIMNKLQEEIRNLVGKKGKVDEDDLPNLPYLKAVIRETFRLYPPAPLLLPREAMERCTLDGYELRPKTVVFINAWAIARDPEYWENPYEFVPERFLNGKVDITGQDFGVIPFGSGRRQCPGMPMGLANVELIVANLVYSFDWEMPPGTSAQDIDLDVIPGVTQQKKNPLLLVAKECMC